MDTAKAGQIATLNQQLFGAPPVNPYDAMLARIDLELAHVASLTAKLATCTTCGGYGEQDDGETKFPCRSCHCRECAQPLSKQFGWCVNLKCDAGQAAARGAA